MDLITKICIGMAVLVMTVSPLYAQDTTVVTEAPVQKTVKPYTIILLITEQNIKSPQRAWWASEINLSSIESAIAQQLIDQGFTVLEPSQLSRVIERKPAFRRVALSEKDTVKLGNLMKADYVVSGKAVASAGGTVPYSTMRSCFANITVKLIRVKDGKVVAYLNGAGNSAHVDAITGGTEALVAAGDDISAKIIQALVTEGGKK